MGQPASLAGGEQNSDLTVSESREGHTPGPWEIISVPELFSRQIQRVGSNTHLIACVSKWEAGTPEEKAEAEANARLIAAAPDLRAEHKNIAVAGNHLASVLIRRLGPDFAIKYPPDLDADSALRLLCATDEYDIWTCWAAIMRARAVISNMLIRLTHTTPETY